MELYRELVQISMYISLYSAFARETYPKINRGNKINHKKGVKITITIMISDVNGLRSALICNCEMAYLVELQLPNQSQSAV